MNKTFKLVTFLAIVAAISGLSIGIVNSFTAPRIEENAIAAEKANLEIIYPGGEFISIDCADDEGVVIGAYEVKDKGYIFKATAKGYNSSNPIIALVGMDKDGKVINVIPLQQAETSGVGTKCFEEGNINNFYIGKAPNDDIDVLTGATFTSKAMISIIENSHKMYEQVK